MVVGQSVQVGWNASKHFNREGEYVGRIEAVGYDWVVIRDDAGEAHSATFATREELYRFFADIGS